MDLSDIDEAPAFNPHIAQLAKSSRSSCKKCKATIDKDSLRLGRQYDNGDRMMCAWYHPQCW